MANFNSRFESAKQDWGTPQDLFDRLNNEFQFTLDAAASQENAKVSKYFTKDDDGLSQSWGQDVVWLNPPYGDGKASLQQWVKKAHTESLSGATVVMLIPARTNTKWFHDYCLTHAEVRFIKGRPKFGDADHGLPLPLCLVVFRPPGVPHPNRIASYAA